MEPRTLTADGAAIRKHRSAAGWTGVRLAQALQISRSHLCNIEKGREGGSELLLRRIAATIGVPANKIATFSDPTARVQDAA